MATAIIIPTVPGNEDVLKQCLNSLHKELEAVGNKDYITHVEWNDFKGFGLSCNKAIKIVFKNPEVDGIFLLNDDITLLECNGKFLNDMIKISKEKNGVVVDTCLHRAKGKMVAMGFCYIPKYILDDIGLFDEQFKMLEWEDVDLSVRIQEAGYTLNHLDYACIEKLSPGKALHSFTEEQTKEVRQNKIRFKEKWKGTKWENL